MWRTSSFVKQSPVNLVIKPSNKLPVNSLFQKDDVKCGSDFVANNNECGKLELWKSATMYLICRYLTPIIFKIKARYNALSFYFHLLQSIYRELIQFLNQVRGTSVILTIENAKIAVKINKQKMVNSIIMVLGYESFRVYLS